MSLERDFERFLSNIVKLNAARVERLQDHVEALDKFIAAADHYGEIFQSTIPAGSWAHETIIKPVDTHDEFDADLLVEVVHQDEWEAREYIEKLYQDLRSSGTYRDKVSRKTRCVRVNYAGDFHVDLVPYMDRWGKTYITNRSEPLDTGRFEVSYPDRFNEWVDRKDRACRGHFRAVVQLLKYLRDHKNTFTCKSIILTTLAGDATSDVAAGLSPERYESLPHAFVSVLEDLAASLPVAMPAVLDPAGSGDNFSDRYSDEWDYENFRTRIRSYATKCREALDESDTDRSERLWQEVFGSSFDRDQSGAKLASLSAVDSVALAAPGEQFIDASPHHFEIQLDPELRATVTGRCTGMAVGNKTFRNGFRQFDLPKHGNRVPKNRKVRFQLTTDVPAPFEVYWKVRNSGDEAASAKQLRGEVSKDAGQLSKTETTSYRGSHYVEAYIVKQGVVVAKDRQRVIVGRSN
ncbi:MAG: cyclic GMP-AMP synthase DncV-like nucleotidyltransferase [Actinomycetota bacterium]